MFQPNGILSKLRGGKLNMAMPNTIDYNAFFSVALQLRLILCILSKYATLLEIIKIFWKYNHTFLYAEDKAPFDS